MSDMGPDPILGDPRFGRAEEELAAIDTARRENAIRDQARGEPYVPLARRAANRLRKVFSNGAPFDTPARELTDEQVWAREEQRRLEAEQSRLNDDA